MNSVVLRRSLIPQNFAIPAQGRGDQRPAFG